MDSSLFDPNALFPEAAPVAPYCSVPAQGDLALEGSFDVIYADKPWRFLNFSMSELMKRGEKWGRAKGRPVYDTMHTRTLSELPLERIAAKDAVLLDWVTFPKQQEAIQSVVHRRNKNGKPIWTYKTVALTWVKLTPSVYKNYCKLYEEVNLGQRSSLDIFRWITGEKLTGIPRLYHFGSGFWTHGNVETCLLYTRGHGASFRKARNVSQLIVSPVGSHSTKPQQAYEKIESLLGQRRYIELFARKSNPPPANWTATGLEFDGLDICKGLGMPPGFWTENQPKAQDCDEE